MIGPNHRGLGSDFSIYAAGQWETPLGTIPIDSDLASRFLKAGREISEDPSAHALEHSLEVLLPLLQLKNPSLRIVPLIVGTMNLEAAKEVALACAEVLALEENQVLVVVSNDMSHYESDEATRKKDRYALEAIQHLDGAALIRAAREYRITMCGLVPVYMLLAMSQKLGIRKGTLVDYRTSADASGDYDRVVGYASFIFE